MNNVTAFIIALTGLVAALGGLGLHFNLRAQVRNAAPQQAIDLVRAASQQLTAQDAKPAAPVTPPKP